MPSPVLMLAFVVNGKTLPQPPVHRMTAFAVIAWICPRHQADRHDAVHPAVVDQQPGHELLVVPRDLVVLQRRLEQRVQHVEAGLVGGEPGAHLLHAAERADGDRPSAAGSTGSPSAPAGAARGGLADERLHGVLVAQPVAARDGVVAVLVERVVLGDDPAAPPSADTVWLRIG